MPSLGILEEDKGARRMCGEHKDPFLACRVSFIIGCDGQNLSETKRAGKEFLKRIACSL